MKMTDLEYRQKLFDAGVRPDSIEGLTSNGLDCVGNIVGIYRTSMEEQDPAHFAIMKFEKRRASYYEPISEQSWSDEKSKSIYLLFFGYAFFVVPIIAIAILGAMRR